MEPKILRPIRRPINTKGRLYYDPPNGSWGILRLKKAIVNNFSDLKEKRSSFSYQMVFYQTPQELEKAVREMKKQDMPLPILLFLVKEAGSND
jgi:hypothetical protein